MLKVTVKFLLIYLSFNVLIPKIVSAYSNHGENGSINGLVFEDKVYNAKIKTVNLYVNSGKRNSRLEPAVINIRSPHHLLLEFDELYEDARYFQAKIFHCNWDWTPSELKPIEYLPTYNEYEVFEYEYSFNTKIPYTHYIFQVPPVLIPGNYLLVLYSKDNEEDLVLSRRFMVFDQQIAIAHSVEKSAGIQQIRTHQQIDFIINYRGLEIFNPEFDIKVVIRQNQSWVTSISNLKPSEIREIDKTLEFRHFNLENNFYGGNEFRFFELNSVRAPGRNVDRVFIQDDKIDAFLFQDKARGSEFYSIWDDLNGGYVIINIDGRDPAIESEYASTHFFLKSAEKIPSDIYIFGKLSDYKLLPDYKMKYDPALGGYFGNLLLKQGWYDYIYYTPDMMYAIEGSHFETRNEYEIFVYYKPQGRITEFLAGYSYFSNQR